MNAENNMSIRSFISASQNTEKLAALGDKLNQIHVIININNLNNSIIFNQINKIV